MGDVDTIILSSCLLEGLDILSYDIVGRCLSNMVGETSRLTLYTGYLSVILVGISSMRMP